jgi:hypothetical protein
MKDIIRQTEKRETKKRKELFGKRIEQLQYFQFYTSFLNNVETNPSSISHSLTFSKNSLLVLDKNLKQR